MKLTEKQKIVLEKIHEFISINSFPPTIRELAQELGFSSPRGVSDHLKALEKKGYIERKTSARSIKLTPKTLGLPGFGREKEALYLPLLGRIAAGQPIYAEENIEEYIPFALELLGKNRADFALRIKGDSMIGDHILDSDIIAVRAQDTADEGDIVVALIKDEAVVKRFHRTEGFIELKSSNEAYLPIEIKNEEGFLIQGKVIAVQRRI